MPLTSSGSVGGTTVDPTPVPTCRLPELVLPPPDGRFELFVVVRGSIAMFVVIVGLTSCGGGMLGAGAAGGLEVGGATAIKGGIGATAITGAVGGMM